MWEHEKLVVYSRSIDAVALLDAVVEGLPSGRAHLKDHERIVRPSPPLIESRKCLSEVGRMLTSLVRSRSTK